jgi:hypothetical protein
MVIKVTDPGQFLFQNGSGLIAVAKNWTGLGFMANQPRT